MKNTSICQQFLEKYPDGPKISRREIASADYSHHNDSRAETVRITIEGIAVRLAILDRFFQNQNSLFQSALKISDPGLSLAHMEDIIRSEKIFLQNIASSETALAHQRADNVDPSLPVVHPTGPLVAIDRLLVAVGRPLVSIILILLIGYLCIIVVGFILLLTRIINFGPLPFLIVLLVCVVKHIISWLLS
ncbi:hypothetical protein EV127DRAFT_443291 [Xylaria flabelliformis]|nr:hypothetical protein EV127DRAFT_443291 [Xylaria flabelliformis]